MIRSVASAQAIGKFGLITHPTLSHEFALLPPFGSSGDSGWDVSRFLGKVWAWKQKLFREFSRISFG
ncbi:hypothetical protein GRI44_00890 [Altererythrobacter confluentis]|uniref:Uncharacterized protein n=1 Tax=Allopontixanthobacter confluentis TaxID=1849021 RepID=A0A6L7GCT4_9SPHN|nr:hypothetical protein [Allopontixanthobacter confluentis]MXP13315.1 hypothetical protein [Allopontixanthobacter confluentis]